MAGAYFITICTQKREHYFGYIENGEMNLSNIGILAYVFWSEIKNHTDNVDLGEFVIMPNHIHGIIIITPPTVATRHALSNPINALSENENINKTSHAMPLQHDENKKIGQNRFQNIGKNSISSIVGSYKSAVTKYANRLALEFSWQKLYHEHIIRNAQSYDKISNYIASNPKSWTEDKFYS